MYTVVRTLKARGKAKEKARVKAAAMWEVIDPHGHACKILQIARGSSHSTISTWQSISHCEALEKSEKQNGRFSISLRFIAGCFGSCW